MSSVARGASPTEDIGLVAVKVMNEGCEALGVQEWHRVSNINRVAHASGQWAPIMAMGGQSQSVFVIARKSEGRNYGDVRN